MSTQPVTSATDMAAMRKRRSDTEDDNCMVVVNGLDGSTSATTSHSFAGTMKPKRHQIATACSHCRDAKLKCSGKHPTCTRCETRDLVCVYDVSEEGVTRREYLRRRYHEQRNELERVTTVLKFLQTGSDGEAAELLARLRLGDSVDQVYSTLEGKGYDNRRSVSPPLARADDLPYAQVLRPTGCSVVNPVRRASHRQDMPDRRRPNYPCFMSSATSSHESLTSQGFDQDDMPEPISSLAEPSWPSHLDPALAHQHTMYPEMISDTMNPRYATHHRYQHRPHSAS